MFGVVHDLIINERRGPAIEYVLLGTVMGVAIAAVMDTVGTSLGAIFATIAAGL